MRWLNELDLFAGIGGIALGLRRAGLCRTVCYVENDPYAQKVLQARFADGELCHAPIWDDVRTFDGTQWRGVVDVVAGGFPCQDISVAGKGAGIHGRRSSLWSEMWRIICEIRPRIVFVENVPALLGRGLGRVLGDLAESGYDAKWDCIPAAAVGAPHRRDRVWIVAYSDSGGQPKPPGQKDLAGLRPNVADTKERAERAGLRTGKESDERRRRSGDSGGARETSDSECTRLAQREGAQGQRPHEAIAGGGRWTTEPNVGRVAHGVPARVDRLRCLGNAVVPQVVEWIGRRIKDSFMEV